jgi:uncharacterized protein (DUF433 family)
MNKYIVSDPNILGGTPVIAGSRIPIEVIFYRLKEGCSVEDIHMMYDWLDRDILEGAIEEAIRALVTTLHGKKILQA